MVGYDDRYNQIVTGKMNSAIRRHATNIDRLNGSGVSGGRDGTSMRRLRNQQDQTFQNVIKQTITPKNVAMQRMQLNLGAGKMFGGSGEFDDDDEEDYDDGYDEPMTGGGAEDDDGDDAPESYHQLRSMVHDYREKRLTGGALTGGLRKMLPHGKKGHAVSLSKMLQKLRKRGAERSNNRVNQLIANSYGTRPPTMGIPTNMPDAEKGKGMSGGGSGDYSDDDEIRTIHDAAFSGGSRGGSFLSQILSGGGKKSKGGYAPVAPTTESLSGFDNRNQPRGLMPPPSVNQQPGMRGGALPLNKEKFRVGLAREPRPIAIMASEADPLARSPAGAGMMVPDANKRGNIGGRKYCNGMGRFAKDGDYIGPSTGAIIPNLQKMGAIGSGRSARGAAVSRVMRERGLSLGEASRYVKEHGY